MSALWTDVRNAYFSYNGMGVNLFFLFVAVIYLLVTDQKRQRNLLIYEIFGILFLMIPVLANAIINRSGSGTGSWLVYGILNAAVLTAFAAADYIMNQKSVKEKIATGIVYIVLLQAGMSLNYSTQYFGTTSNLYKIPSEAVQIAEEIEFLEEPRILAPAEIAGGIRQYDTDYAVIYGTGLSYTPQDLAQFTQEITVYGCNCVVVETEYDNVEHFNELGFSKIASTKHYEVYAK